VRKPKSAKFFVVNNPEENDSRRLHQPSLAVQAKVARRSFSEGGLSQSVTSYGWQANVRFD
jgi:hypothetical protein